MPELLLTHRMPKPAPPLCKPIDFSSYLISFVSIQYLLEVSLHGPLIRLQPLSMASSYALCTTPCPNPTPSLIVFLPSIYVSPYCQERRWNIFQPLSIPLRAIRPRYISESVQPWCYDDWVPEKGNGHQRGLWSRCPGVYLEANFCQWSIRRCFGLICESIPVITLPSTELERQTHSKWFSRSCKPRRITQNRASSFRSSPRLLHCHKMSSGGGDKWASNAWGSYETHASGFYIAAEERDSASFEYLEPGDFIISTWFFMMAAQPWLELLGVATWVGLTMLIDADWKWVQSGEFYLFPTNIRLSDLNLNFFFQNKWGSMMITRRPWFFRLWGKIHRSISDLHF